MEDYQGIKIKPKGGIVSLWLARPDKRNAINLQMANELIQAIQVLEADKQVTVVVIRGEGEVFCAGADLGWINKKGLPPDMQPSRLLAKLYQTLYTFKKPLIALVHGSAMGGALGLMAAADYVLANKNVRLSFAEVKRGLVPATISPFVVRRCGEFRARQLMLSGTVIDATQGKEAGLIDIIATDEILEKEITRLCDELKLNGPEAMTNCKQLLIKVANDPLDDKLMDYTAGVLEKVRLSKEATEGVEAFLEKRKPNWIKD